MPYMVDSVNDTEGGPAHPLHRRLEDLWTEAARAGQNLPGEPTLSMRLDSSRPAVREALIRLEERGYIHRRKGADTVVNTSLLGVPARFDERLDASTLIAAMGCTPKVDVLAASTSRISVEEATEHDLLPSTQVYRVTKRWSADGVPVLLAHDSVPLTRPIDPDTIDPDTLDPTTSMVDLAEELMGERVGWEMVWPAAEALDEESAGTVGLATGEPALGLAITGVSPRGSVCYWTNELHLRGFFRYAMVRRAAWR